MRVVERFNILIEMVKSYLFVKFSTNLIDLIYLMRKYPSTALEGRSTPLIRIGFGGFFLILISSIPVLAQTPNESILRLLAEKNIITQKQADSIRESSASQSKPTKTFRIDLDFRPRSEIRNGYGKLRNDTTRAALFTNHRSRVLITYQQQGLFTFHTSIQDIRVWGDKDPRSNAGTLQLFEAWVEPQLFKNVSLRAGRQKLSFDNQRLFAENDWRPNSGAHDAFNLRIQTTSLQSELAVAWNQNAQDANTAERFFDTQYNGIAPYKGLVVHYLKYKTKKHWTLTSLQASDAFQSTNSADDKEQLYVRFTNGGRLEWEKENWYATLSGYYQWGHLAQGKSIQAWYWQPEIRWSNSQTTLRLGAEVMSGNNARRTDADYLANDHNFVPLYGVAHRFNGSMDFFTRFPADLNQAGLVNPYLFFIKKLNSKVEARSDFHLFFSEGAYRMSRSTEDFEAGTIIPSYLGFENDFLLTWRPNDFTKIDAGFSYALPTASMKEILSKAKGNGHAGLLPTWWYISLSFKPNLFLHKS
ncbi:MAG: alginate export family protein [Cytophagaceae bacterium]|jgi:hypothetical protein|nr:alginate export family protein [Cytophagaceae bacterium]